MDGSSKLIQKAFFEASGKALATRLFARTHRTYKYGYTHAAQKEQRNITLLIEH
jgi:hypothetical protein